ncbi:MAG TPA: inositol monophosphatase [Gammaproteobacteria bacterium]|nr:inositol monophosphatase [Gammaproteobacteria bacterium]
MHPMLNIAVRAARRGGTIINRALNRLGDIRVDTKGHKNYVSEIDQEAETSIIQTLLAAYPEHRIVAEESGARGDSDYEWIIDPLDGTTNFLHGYPQFSVSIALAVRGELDQAVIFDPVRDELFTASRGAGAQLNNRRIRVSECQSLDHALLATGFPIRNPALIDSYLPTLNAFLPHVAGVRRAGAASLDLAFVACGRLDGFWEYGLQPWDIAAGMLLVQEAGGIVTEPNGADEPLKNGSILCASPRIHREMLKTLAIQGA